MKIITSVKVDFDGFDNLKTIRRRVKANTGYDLRRMDRFTLIAMQATHKLLVAESKQERRFQGVVGLYGVANYFSVELLQSLIVSVEQKLDVKPFDFIISVGNAANFFIAKQFGFNGPNVFLGASEYPENTAIQLIQADADLGIIEHAISICWSEKDNNLECVASLLSKGAN